MKKILSLLALLVMTLTASAFEFTDSRVVTFGLVGDTNADDAKLTVTDNGNGTYNVEFQDIIVQDGSYTDNYGTFVFENVPGTSDGTLTTISGSGNQGKVKPRDYPTISFTYEWNLTVKFNDSKAYAKVATSLPVYGSTDFTVVFGTDDFGSTGGGTEGGGETPSITKVLEDGYQPAGQSFAFPFTIDWDTQKLVAELDLSTCSQYTHNEGIITVGTDNGNTDISLWNPNYGEANLHLYYTLYNYGTDTKLLNLHYLENPSGTTVRHDNTQSNLEGTVVFTLDKEGLHVGDNLIAAAAEMPLLYKGTNYVFGSKEGSTRSNATYNYVEVRPLEQTNPDPTVESSKEFTDKAAMSYAGSDPTDMGTAKVTVDNMSDDSYNLSLEFGGNTYKATGVEKGTDDKGRTTYAGSVNIGGADYQLYAIVYTDEESTEKIYLTATSAVVTFIIGSDPDYVAPLTFPIENYQADGTGFTVSTPIDWETQKFQAVIDASNCSSSNTEDIFGFGPEATVWENNIHIYADKGSYKAYYQCSNGNNNTTVNVADNTNITVEVSKTEGLTVDGVSIIAADKLEGLFDLTEVKFGSGENNQFSNAFYKSVKLVDAVPPFVPETKTYTDLAYSSFNGTTTNYENKTVEVTSVDENTYKVVYKDIVVGDNRIGDFTVSDVTATTDETTGVVTYSTTATEGTWNNINSEVSMILGIFEGGAAPLTSFTAKVTPAADETSEASMDMTIATTFNNAPVTFVFGDKYVAPVDPNEVVETKTYTDNLTVGHDAQTGDVTGYADKQVVFTKYANGESSVTFKEFPISETETRDLTFRGIIGELAMTEEGVGTVTYGEDLAMTPIEDETSAFYGKEISLFITISSYTAEKMEFTYEFGSEDGIYYVGQYGVEIEQPNEITGSKTYTSNLTVDHDANLSNEVVYENKDVRFDKYSNGDVAVTFVAYPVSENETCDLTFRGTIQEYDMSEYGMGKMIFGDGLVCKVENEASSFNGKTLYLSINIKLNEDDSPTFSYTFANDVDEEGEGAESIYYCGRFNVDDITNGINGVETEMENGNVSIYTVGGAKLNTLQKGINIVRLANGKTIKVIK